jgi:hypothetical protein
LLGSRPCWISWMRSSTRWSVHQVGDAERFQGGSVRYLVI